MTRSGNDSAERATTTTETHKGPDNKQNSRRQRFARANRLSDAAAFSRVFRGAEKSRDAYFTVLSKANGTGIARLGLAISKKHCRFASGRNRLKRIVRESFRHRQQELAGLDVVVIGQQAASGADNRTLFDSLAGHWQKTIRRAGTG